MKPRLQTTLLLATLIAFIVSSWGGLVQWWQGMSFRRKMWTYLGAGAVASGVASRYIQVNPLILYAGFILASLAASLVYVLVLLFRE